jgi:hypothetical protein
VWNILKLLANQFRIISVKLNYDTAYCLAQGTSATTQLRLIWFKHCFHFGLKEILAWVKILKVNFLIKVIKSVSWNIQINFVIVIFKPICLCVIIIWSIKSSYSLFCISALNELIKEITEQNGQFLVGLKNSRTCVSF